jgi:chromate transporter
VTCGDIAHEPPTQPGRLSEVAWVFTKLGLTAFGGPAAHIAMMRDEVVIRRAWVTDSEFLDLLGGANILPGPSSTELALFLGNRRAGKAGLLLAGAGFILPAVVMVLALAWAYVRFGGLPATGRVLYGVKPVVIAIIIRAIWPLARAAIRGPFLALLSLAVLVFYFIGVAVLPLLVGSGLIGLAFGLLREHTTRSPGATAVFVLSWTTFSPHGMVAGAQIRHGSPSLWSLFTEFLKLGALVLGSGYVLLAFLQSDIVHQHAWLTQRQVLDAVAVGQVTPGPLFSTATFLGYLIAGLPGAGVATLGIFLPAFAYTAVTGPFIVRLRNSKTLRGFLDGVNVAALALIVGVCWTLGTTAVVDVVSAGLCVVALLLLFWRNVPPIWLILGGAAAGLAYRSMV